MPKKLPKRATLAFAALIIAHILWGAATPIIKISLAEVPPFTFLFLRFLVVGLIVLPFTYFELKQNPINKKDISNLIILGLLGQSSLIFLFIGLQYTTSIDAAILSVLAPLMSIVAGHHFFNEKVNDKVKTGVALATLGTLIVLLEPVLANETSNISITTRLWGDFMIILYNVAFTAFILWSKMVMGESSVSLRDELKHFKIKPMHKTYSPTLITLLTFFVALASFIPFSLLEVSGYIGNQPFNFNQLDGVGILGILYMAVFSSIVAYILFQWGLEESSVADTAILGYLTPVFTLPFSYMMLREIPTQLNIIGMIIISLGVVICEKYRGNNKKVRAKKA